MPTNRISATGVTYDNNGNRRRGSAGLTFTYDKANRMTAVGGSAERRPMRTIASNLRVYSRNASGAETVYFYGADGKKLATYTYAIITYSREPGDSVDAAERERIFPGQADLGGRQHGAGGPAWGRCGRAARAGWGIRRSIRMGWSTRQTANDREKYATYTRDSVTGLGLCDEPVLREPWGRFLSPDPSSCPWRPRGSAELESVCIFGKRSG